MTERKTLLTNLLIYSNVISLVKYVKNLLLIFKIKRKLASRTSLRTNYAAVS